MYANVMVRSKEKGWYQEVRYGLHLLAKILILFRELSGDPNARSVALVRPENYDLVVEAVMQLAGKVLSSFTKKILYHSYPGVLVMHMLEILYFLLLGASMVNVPHNMYDM